MNKDTRFLEAIKQCEDNMRYAVEHNQVLEYENKIVQGNCIELMKKIPNNTFDLVLTDPPPIMLKV